MTKDTWIYQSAVGGIVFCGKSMPVDEIRRTILNATEPRTGVLDIQRIGHRRYYARQGCDERFIDRVFSGLPIKEGIRYNPISYSKYDFRQKDTRVHKWEVYDAKDLALNTTSNTKFGILKRNGKIIYYIKETPNDSIDRGLGIEQVNMIHIVSGEDALERLVDIVLDNLRRKFHPQFFM